MKTITVESLKKALYDPNFISAFPELKDKISKYHSNPGCSCNTPLYHDLFSKTDKLKAYFGEEITIKNDAALSPPAPVMNGPTGQRPPVKNDVKVINCTINDLEEKLKGLPQGHVQIALARYEDKITVVVNIIS